MMKSAAIFCLKCVALAALMSPALISCRQDKQCVQAEISVNDTSVMTVAGVHPWGPDSLLLYFNESAMVYNICAQNTRIGMHDLRKIIGVDCQLKVVRDFRTNEILFLDEPTRQEDSAYNQTRSPLLASPAPRFDIDLSKDDTDALNRNLPDKNFTAIDLTAAERIFRYCARRACAAEKIPRSVNCIPFHYLRDGCYARAHRMGQEITDIFHIDVRKVFSLTKIGEFLCVNTQPIDGCQIPGHWGYHVAVIVKVKTDGGVAARVIDPSMFGGPVSLSTWLKAQEYQSSRFAGHVSYYSIQALQAFEPASNRIDYSTDSDYQKTDRALNTHRGRNTCN